MLVNVKHLSSFLTDLAVRDTVLELPVPVLEAVAAALNLAAVLARHGRGDPADEEGGRSDYANRVVQKAIDDAVTAAAAVRPLPVKAEGKS